MMSRTKRLSAAGSLEASRSSPVQTLKPAADDWTAWWSGIYAKDLVDLPIHLLDAGTAVEEACEVLLSKNLACVGIKSNDGTLTGLFDFADVNAFLTLAATQHTMTKEDLDENPRADQILTAAKAGKVPVHLVSDLSGKNKLETLPHDSTLLDLLAVFSRGTHRVLVQAQDPMLGYQGLVTDASALAHITSSDHMKPSFAQYLTNRLQSLELPSMYLYTAVVSVSSSDNTLDAMRLMSEYGVSSVAVLEEGSGRLLSAISVTDVGKVVVPTQSNQILTTEMQQLISIIREPFGSTDGEEHYPVYSVTPESTLTYTIQKLMATNSHRLFVTDLSPELASPSSASLDSLCGVVSIVDILALFARVANVPGVNPLQAQTSRRMSTSSSRSSWSGSSRSSSLSGTRVRVNSSGLGPYAPASPISVPIPRSSSRGANVAQSPGSMRGAPASPRVSKSFVGVDGV